MGNTMKTVDEILSSKVKFKRALIAISTILIILGIIAFFTLTDQSCDWKNFVFGTKSKVSVDVKKGN